MTNAVVHITTGELAAELRVDASTIRRWVEAGRLIPAITTPGGHHRFIREDALAALAPKPRDSAPSPSGVDAGAPAPSYGAPATPDGTA